MIVSPLFAARKAAFKFAPVAFTIAALAVADVANK
jgi:hypothetical protein